MKKLLTSLLVAALTAVSSAAPTDLSYPPTTSGGHDLNHMPVGQSFTATASNVHGGIYVADQTSFTTWLSTIYPGQILAGSYPYAVAPSMTVRVDLLNGEGTGGAVLHSTTRVLTAPFSGFVDVDYGAAGVLLTVGQKYTMLLTDVSGQTYPQGVTGWVAPSVTDPTPGAGQPVYDTAGNVVGYSPYGAYYSGLPILQGALVANDAGIGDNSFQVIDNSTLTVQTVSGVNAVITAYVARNPGFIVINGGLNLNDHLWTNNLNPTNTTFLGGLVNWYQTGLLVDYTGTVTSQGLLLTQLTVKPAPAALVVSSANLPSGTVGVPYSAPITVIGGLPPYTGSVIGMPAGLSYDGNNVIGTPTASGVSALTITVTDALGHTASASPTLTINPAPANYTIRDEGQGKISAIGAGYLLVGTKKLVWNSSTLINVNEAPSGSRTVIDSFVKVGMKVQWKGLRDAASGTVLTSKLEIN
jgi:hypothetical protein